MLWKQSSFVLDMVENLVFTILICQIKSVLNQSTMTNLKMYGKRILKPKSAYRPGTHDVVKTKTFSCRNSPWTHDCEVWIYQQISR